jgi:signal transduction histidine kinase
MKIRIGLIASLLVSSVVLYASGQQPRAEKGVIHLTQTDQTGEFTYKLNGEWEFYWNKLFRPADFRNLSPLPDMYGEVPSYWTDYPEDIVGKGTIGYATYRLKAILPTGFRKPLAVDLPVFDSSYDIYINGKYSGWNGVVGRTAEESRPEYRRVFFRFEPATDTLEIIINVSNFSHRRGGFWLPVKIGTFNKIQSDLANSWAADWSTISLLLGFSIFFFFFFLINPKEKVLGYFCLATIGLAFRPMFTSHFLIYNLINLSWEWTVRFEYMGLYVVIIGWTWVAYELYPSAYFRGFTFFITILFILIHILTHFLPVRVFCYSIMLIYPVMLVLILYSIVQSFFRAIRGSGIDITYFIAFLLLAFAGLHDVRVSLGKTESSGAYIMSYAVVTFVLIQAALLLLRWVKSYRENERLRNELGFMNKNLENIVNERTRELKLRNEEIGKQNLMIAAQNKQLTDTIQMKNKIFSVIAHDLRGPVVNILYMLNLLKEKEYREKYDTFANSSIQYAQMVISLLENMLVWGRGQEDRIKYSPGRYNIADIILTNLSIFKESADKKEITVNFTQIGSSTAWLDKDLLDIVIRNLLSNALKYTPRGGRISILLRDRSNEEGGMLIKICDNGIGIPEDKQKTLFSEEIEMTSTPGTENEKGTGLGLKLCHELIKISQGTISVESREGEGSCFSIMLPPEPVG